MFIPYILYINSINCLAQKVKPICPQEENFSWRPKGGRATYRVSFALLRIHARYHHNY